MTATDQLTVLYGDNAVTLNNLLAGDQLTRPLTGDPSWDEIDPVWSGGRSENPDIALVFINPTWRNQAARDGWPPEMRAPHIGYRRMWDFLAGCQLLPGSALAHLPADCGWEMGTAATLYERVAESGLYVTNLVKACRTTSEMPTMPLARSYLSLLTNELEIVKPRIIITMGELVTSMVVGRLWQRKMYRMRDLTRFLETTGQPMSFMTMSGLRVVPSYFPAGRGEPARARAIITAAGARLRHDHGPDLNCQACYYGESSQWTASSASP